MNETIKKQLDKLDVNGDGKVDIEDAEDLIERELAKKSPVKVAGVSFVTGLVVGFFAGRASK